MANWRAATKASSVDSKEMRRIVPIEIAQGADEDHEDRRRDKDERTTQHRARFIGGAALDLVLRRALGLALDRLALRPLIRGRLRARALAELDHIFRRQRGRIAAQVLEQLPLADIPVVALRHLVSPRRRRLVNGEPITDDAATFHVHVDPEARKFKRPISKSRPAAHADVKGADGNRTRPT
jgi:hypothetical protein